MSDNVTIYSYKTGDIAGYRRGNQVYAGGGAAIAHIQGQTVWVGESSHGRHNFLYDGDRYVYGECGGGEVVFNISQQGDKTFISDGRGFDPIFYCNEYNPMALVAIAAVNIGDLSLRMAGAPIVDESWFSHRGLDRDDLADDDVGELPIIKSYIPSDLRHRFGDQKLSNNRRERRLQVARPLSTKKHNEHDSEDEVVDDVDDGSWEINDEEYESTDEVCGDSKNVNPEGYGLENIPGKGFVFEKNGKEESKIYSGTAAQVKNLYYWKKGKRYLEYKGRVKTNQWNWKVEDGRPEDVDFLAICPYPEYVWPAVRLATKEELAFYSHGRYVCDFVKQKSNLPPRIAPDGTYHVIDGWHLGLKDFPDIVPGNRCNRYKSGTLRYCGCYVTELSGRDFDKEKRDEMASLFIAWGSLLTIGGLLSWGFAKLVGWL